LRSCDAAFRLNTDMVVKNWMSWTGGVDLVASTHPDFKQPNVILHVAQQVTTSRGTSAAGMVLWMPDPTSGPAVMGFLSDDDELGTYFGPNIFGGTPFESAPVLGAKITTHIGSNSAAARIEVATYVFEIELGDLQPEELISRQPTEGTPFYQQGLERKANRASLRVNGEDVMIFVPSVGISGGPGAVVAASGLYARP
jgi:hypothetical protein